MATLSCTQRDPGQFIKLYNMSKDAILSLAFSKRG